MAGDGGLRQWQITNTVNHLAHVPDSFFAIRCVYIMYTMHIIVHVHCPFLYALLPALKLRRLKMNGPNLNFTLPNIFFLMRAHVYSHSCYDNV